MTPSHLVYIVMSSLLLIPIFMCPVKCFCPGIGVVGVRDPTGEVYSHLQLRHSGSNNNSADLVQKDIAMIFKVLCIYLEAQILIFLVDYQFVSSRTLFL